MTEGTGVEVLKTVIDFYKENPLMGEKQVQFENFREQVLPIIATRVPRKDSKKPEGEGKV